MHYCTKLKFFAFKVENNFIFYYLFAKIQIADWKCNCQNMVLIKKILANEETANKINILYNYIKMQWIHSPIVVPKLSTLWAAPGKINIFWSL